MKVNNDIYETLGHMWWSNQAGFEITSLRYAINPVRHGYFKTQALTHVLPNTSLLDIGCGGGFLAEEFAKDGFEVTGMDPAERSIEAARKHASEVGLSIRYQVGRGEALPFPDKSFSVVACCDVLEHVDDVARVLQEVTRVLQPSGVFLFDTVNRTIKSWFVLIKLWQDWGLAGIPRNAHVWKKFIKPAELVSLMRTHGMNVKDMKGIGPKKNPLAFLSDLRRLRTGQLQGPAVGDVFAMCPTKDLSISYMGWAVRSEASFESR